MIFSPMMVINNGENVFENEEQRYYNSRRNIASGTSTKSSHSRGLPRREYRYSNQNELETVPIEERRHIRHHHREKTKSSSKSVAYDSVESKVLPYSEYQNSSSSMMRPIRGQNAGKANFLLLQHRHQRSSGAGVIPYEQMHNYNGDDLITDSDHNLYFKKCPAGTGNYCYGDQKKSQPPLTAGYGFVRTCDGKFVRTVHDAEETQNQQQLNCNHNRNHKVKRRQKRIQMANNSDITSSHRSEYCSVSRSDLTENINRFGRSAQTYATLRGSKWTHKEAGRINGCGDNYGRRIQTSRYLDDDDSRSLASFTDEYVSLNSNGYDSTYNTLQRLQNKHDDHYTHFHHQHYRMIPPFRESKATALSQSTDRNLNSTNFPMDASAKYHSNYDNNQIHLNSKTNAMLSMTSSQNSSSEELLTLITREPPDGKEKPEPSRSSQYKNELTSSKTCSHKLFQKEEAEEIEEEDYFTMKKSSNLFRYQEFQSKHRKVISESNEKMILKPRNTHQDMMNIDQYTMRNYETGATVLRSKEWKSETSNNILTPPGSPTVDSSTSSSAASISNSPKCSSSLSGVPLPSLSSTTTPSAVIKSKQDSAAAARVKIQYSLQSAAGVGGGMAKSVNNSATPASVEFHKRKKSSCVSEPVLNISTGSANTFTMLSPSYYSQWFKRTVLKATTQFFGIDEVTQENSKIIWNERRRRMAIKKFGGLKEEYSESGIRNGNYLRDGSSRLRQDVHLTSEMEGDKMVLKITKPPRNKDSLGSLIVQSITSVLNFLALKNNLPKHFVIENHEISRSYQPSTTGIAAYYQAEQVGGLAVCAPPFPRSNSLNYLHGEGPAEEVFFTSHNSVYSWSVEEGNNNSRMGQRFVTPFSTATDGYSYRSCRSWQLTRPKMEFLAPVPLPPPPRMSSDVGATRIWSHLLDASFDNSDRRKHCLGGLGRFLVNAGRGRAGGTGGRRLRRPPESNRKRNLAGNAGDHRPYFTYWVMAVQILVLIISISVYGIGPVGIDLHKKTGMVLVTNLELEAVSHYVAGNFWIGPSAPNLIHLGAKYSPCMRWDKFLDREIKSERLKERDSACCIRKDRAGCVQSPKSECSKIGEPGSGYGSDASSPPRSNWWRPSKWYSIYPSENRRSSGPVCGLDPAFCETPASVAPYIWPDDITKWPICRKKSSMDSLYSLGDGSSAGQHTAEHMICEIIGHPCCIGIRGYCQITTKEYCNFVIGVYHDEAALCSQVSCLDDVCGLLPFHTRDVPDQFYRTWTPIFLHAGILHLALSISFQYWFMRDIEKLIGAPRISIIYLGSGMVGNLASALFVPYRAEVGPAGSNFGLIACSLVEIIYLWPKLKYPEMAVFKLVGLSSVFFLIGLLPWIDNYAHLFGFLTGLLLSFAIVPFATIGGSGSDCPYNRKKKIILILSCLLLVTTMFIGIVVLFYVTQPIHDCEWCKYLNCIPITKDFCSVDQDSYVRGGVAARRPHTIK